MPPQPNTRNGSTLSPDLNPATLSRSKPLGFASASYQILQPYTTKHSMGYGETCMHNITHETNTAVIITESDWQCITTNSYKVLTTNQLSYLHIRVTLQSHHNTHSSSICRHHLVSGINFLFHSANLLIITLLHSHPITFTLVHHLPQHFHHPSTLVQCARQS